MLWIMRTCVLWNPSALADSCQKEYPESATIPALCTWLHAKGGLVDSSADQLCDQQVVLSLPNISYSSDFIVEAVQ
jgi:hypothetical protein